MKKSILYLMMMAGAGFMVQSCMDYDNPGDEVSVDQGVGDATHYQGNVDSINYMRVPVETEVDSIIEVLQPYFGYNLSCSHR